MGIEATTHNYEFLNKAAIAFGLGDPKKMFCRKMGRKDFKNKKSRVGRGILGVITIGMIDTIEKTGSDWSVIAEQIMFWLVKSGEPFSADSFYSRAVAESMPPSMIKKFSGAMFREFQGAGYIRKRKDYILSQRNGAACLPLWENATQKK